MMFTKKLNIVFIDCLIVLIGWNRRHRTMVSKQSLIARAKPGICLYGYNVVAAYNAINIVLKFCTKTELDSADGFFSCFITAAIYF